ncbi:MAG: T9SS type A sorting domain-containing protein [Flavobacteriales bacterium]|nr:T9SS type A sorting domain-containing protein [Flavobacteriales bacterium]
MKKLVLILTLTFSYVFSFAQCTPNSLYQDSTSGTWPDTIQNLPHVTQGAAYYTVIDIKTPATLIEAANGDSSQTQIDTVIFGFPVSEYIGHWPVDSMILVQVNGLPAGISMDCNTGPSCSFPGDAVGCANVLGTTNDPIGIYPIEILINVFTHGTLSGIPVNTDIYSATGSYESIDGYKIVIDPATGIQTFHQEDFTLFQNFPNPFAEKTNILFNSPKSTNVEFSVIDMFGRIVFSEEIAANRGVNTYEFNNNLSAGIYMSVINNGEERISKPMVVAEK